MTNWFKNCDQPMCCNYSD